MLNLIHSNRMEDLASALGEILAQPLSHPLRAECVMVQTQGLGQWLQWHLADTHGVCANIEFPFPAAWLWDLYIRFIDASIPRSVFSKPHMAWLLFSMMDELRRDALLAPLQRYLDRGSFDRNQFQLAWALADIFDQYLVYRPDWVLAWEASESVIEWQGHIWGKLIERYIESTGEQLVWHRARLLDRFITTLKQEQNLKGQLPERLLVFGVSALPPYMIEVLSHLGKHIPVYLFMLNPCEFFWADTPSKKQLLNTYEHPLSGDFHPLLSSLGRCGRDLLSLLSDHIAVDIPLFSEPTNQTALTTIQSSLLHGRIEQVPYEANDLSVQIHACHSRRREIEVLNDQLLALFDRNPDLTPRDIVVMAPDIQAYLPWVKAIFGRYEDARHIPWSASDVSKMHRLPLLETVLQLFNLPNTKPTVNEVLDWLMIPAVAVNRGVSSEDRSDFMQLLRNSSIHWGLSSAHRNVQGYGEYDRHTFEFGLDRIVMGAFVGGSMGLIKGVAPVPLHDSVTLQKVLILDRWVEDLERWCDELAQAKMASEWCDWVCDWLGQVLGESDQALETVAVVREVMVTWSSIVDQVDMNNKISHAIVNDVLNGEFTQRDAGVSFLGKGVTFCSLTPMRSIPFKVLCLLGMSEGEFPRYAPPSGLDLMADHPRKGDRIRKEEDRFLFLEAILSAREFLCISYIGRDVRDNSIRLPSSVVMELISLMQALFRREEPQPDPQQWIIEHPLQPFNSHYFSGGDLFSYAKEWITSENIKIAKSCHTNKAQIFDISWDDFARFWKNPLRCYGMNVLHLSDFHIREYVSDVEPQAVNPLNSFQWHDAFLGKVGEDEASLDLFQQWQASGRMVEAESAKKTFKNDQAVIKDWIGQVRQTYEWVKETHSFRIEVDGLMVKGIVPLITRSRYLCVWPAPMRWDHRLNFWLNWLLISSQCDFQGADLWFFDRKESQMKKEVFVRPDNPLSILQDYLIIVRDGLKNPFPFFPKFHGKVFEQTVVKNKELSLAVNDGLQSDNHYNPYADRWSNLIFPDGIPLTLNRIEDLNQKVFQPMYQHWVKA